MKVPLPLRRWLDLVLLAITGGAIICVASALASFRPSGLYRLHPSLFLAVGFVVLVFVGHQLQSESAWRGDKRRPPLKRRLFAFFGLTHFIAYPPIWVSAALGSTLLLLLLSRGVAGLPNLGPRDQHILLARVALLPLLPVVLCGLADRLRWLRRTAAPRLPETPRNPPREPLGGSWEGLRTWLKNDDPVSAPEQDAFGHVQMARRIAKRLQQVPIPSVAVVGPLGSGKTTVRCLVDDSLTKACADVRLVPVELWPFDTPQAAVEGVLRALIAEIALEVNVVAVRGLPSRYLRAMGAVGELAAVAASWEGADDTPFQVLERIDQIATTIGLRFVIWVEDMERFAGHVGSGEELEQARRLDPLRALLFGLSRMTSLGVVTATTSLHARFDTEKIARFVEEVLELDWRQTLRALASFRRHCLAMPFIDPASAEVRKKWGGLGSEEGLEISAAFGARTYPSEHALLSMCRTPRSLKQGLRETRAIWEVLAGEIDFDDLLAMSILRQANPTAFALVRENHPALVLQWITPEQQKEVRERFEQGLARVDSAGAVLPVIKSIILERPGSPELHPQGLQMPRYWQRFLECPDALPEVERDQPVLEAIQSGDDERLLDLIESKQADQVENFARLIPPAQLLRVLVPHTRRQVSVSPKEWFRPNEWPTGQPPGLIRLCILWGSAERRGALPFDEAMLALQSALVVAVENLHLARELEHFFLDSGEGGVFSSRGAELAAAAATVRQNFWQVLVQRYAQDAAGLARALRGSDPWTLCRIVWGSERLKEKPREGKPFPGWEGFALTILEAVRADTSEVLPQLATLIAREMGDVIKGGRHQTSYAFDEQRCVELFGDVEPVLSLFREKVERPTRAQAAVDAVRAAASKFERGR